MKQEKNTPLDWHKKIESSEGWRITYKIDMLQLTYTIFDTNYKHLNRILDMYKRDESIALQLMGADRRDEFSAFLSEVTRLLHNFLASVKSLVDHTRIFCNEEYKGKAFADEYQIELNKRFDIDLVKFVQELRNYALHQRLPVTGAKFSFDVAKGTSHSVTLNIADLKDWSGWKSKARSFLNTSDEELDLQEVIKEYASITESFYKWFGNRQKEIHKQDLEDLKKLQQAFRKVLEEKGYFRHLQ